MKMKKTQSKNGFTLIEMLVASAIMLIVVIAALAVYARSNKVAVDQQQFTELQNEVRSGMYFISRDIRSAGVGLVDEIAGYFLEGTDGFGPGPEAADSIKVMGNFDSPLNLMIDNYQGGVGGGAATVFLVEWSLENSPYTCPDDFEEKTYMILSTQCPGCYAFRYVGANSVFGCGGGIAHINFQPGASEINPPGGLVDTGCVVDCWDGGIITFGQIKHYWLDTSGNPADYTEFTLSAGQDGYLGIANTLYLTTYLDDGSLTHVPLAMDIENLQFQYNGDLDEDGNLDGFTDWNDGTWTINLGDDSATRLAKAEIISRIQLVRIWVLGRTPSPYISIRGTNPTPLDIYKRPAIANSPASAQDDNRRRFLLDSTAMIRNLALDLYNIGTR